LKTFEKLPVRIEAILVGDENREEIEALPNVRKGPEGSYVLLSVSGGSVVAMKGEWICRNPGKDAYSILPSFHLRHNYKEL